MRKFTIILLLNMMLFPLVSASPDLYCSSESCVFSGCDNGLLIATGSPLEYPIVRSSKKAISLETIDSGEIKVMLICFNPEVHVQRERFDIEHKPNFQIHSLDESPKTKIGLHGMKVDDFMTNPVPGIDVFVGGASSDSIETLHNKGYEAASILNIYKYITNDVDDVQNEIEPAKEVARDFFGKLAGNGYDIIIVDELVMHLNKIYSEDVSADLAVEIFNDAKSEARRANPNVKVGIVEPKVHYISLFLENGGEPDFVSGEDYGLFPDEVQLSDLNHFKDEYGVETQQWVIGVDEGLSYVGHVELMIFADVDNDWNCCREGYYLDEVSMAMECLNQGHDWVDKKCTGVSDNCDLCSSYNTCTDSWCGKGSETGMRVKNPSEDHMFCGDWDDHRFLCSGSSDLGQWYVCASTYDETNWVFAIEAYDGQIVDGKTCKKSNSKWETPATSTTTTTTTSTTSTTTTTTTTSTTSTTTTTTTTSTTSTTTTTTSTSTTLKCESPNQCLSESTCESDGGSCLDGTYSNCVGIRPCCCDPETVTTTSTTIENLPPGDITVPLIYGPETGSTNIHSFKSDEEIDFLIQYADPNGGQDISKIYFAIVPGSGSPTEPAFCGQFEQDLGKPGHFGLLYYPYKSDLRIAKSRDLPDPPCPWVKSVTYNGDGSAKLTYKTTGYTESVRTLTITIDFSPPETSGGWNPPDWESYGVHSIYAMSVDKKGKGSCGDGSICWKKIRTITINPP